MRNRRRQIVGTVGTVRTSWYRRLPFAGEKVLLKVKWVEGATNAGPSIIE